MREIIDRCGISAAFVNLGNAYSNLGEQERASEYHKQALSIDLEIRDRRGEATHLENMSRALNLLDERMKAIELVKTMLKIYEQIEDPTTEKARKQLAEWKSKRKC